jgi:outer membrane protein TolC
MIKLGQCFGVFCIVGSFTYAGTIEQGAWDQVRDIETTRATAGSVSKTGVFSSDTVSLADCEIYTETHNPELAAALFVWKAALARVPQMRSFEDPWISYSIMSGEPMPGVAREQKAGVSQMFHWYGTRELMAREALAEADMMRWKYEAAKLNLTYRVNVSYYELHYLNRALVITRENIDLLRYWEKLITSKYTTATASQPDLLKTQMEISSLENQRQTMDNMRKSMQTELNALLNIPLHTHLLLPGKITRQPVTPDEAAIRTLLAENNPDVRAMNADISRQEILIGLKKKRYYPSLMLGLEYTFPASGDVMLMGALNLPVWRANYRSGVSEARAGKNAQEDQKENMVNMLVAKAVQLMYQAQDGQRRSELYGNELIPKARQTLKIQEALYSTGAADILELIDTQRMLLEYEMLREEALARHWQKLAELELLFGRKLQ